MPEETLSLDVRGAAVSVMRTRSDRRSKDCTFIYAPGAGSNLHDGFGAHLAVELAGQGIETWRLEFPYMAAGKKRPDPPAVLMETWRAVLALAASEEAGQLVIGGRSMGGRIPSIVVADSAEVHGLALFAYPLIPPGRPSSARSEHLPRVRVPTLFCSGTRDSFAMPEELREAAGLVPDARVHLLEGADHGFSVLKASGRSREDVWREATTALLDFSSGLQGR